MKFEAILKLKGIRVLRVEDSEEQVLITARTLTKQARCPSCGANSQRVHSYYWRSIQDLPLQASRVRLRLRVKRLRCINEHCSRSTFVERLPEVVGWHQQRTVRLNQVLSEIAFAVGGEVSRRVVAHLSVEISGDSLLRLIRRHCPASTICPKQIGVDDWCYRRGVRYGTLIVDLETHRPIDLLPDREVHTLAAWLKQHPQLEIVSRDRARPYAEGIREGAPQAQQVADRWHILKNLGDSLRQSFEHHATLLRQVVVELPIARPSTSACPPVLPATTPRPARALRPEEQARAERRAGWEAIFQQAHALLARGMSVSAVARKLGIDRSTVGKYKQLPVLPPRTCIRLGPRLLDPFRDYIRQRVIEANPVGRTYWPKSKRSALQAASPSSRPICVRYALN